jgi:hypothetical protein
MMDSPWILFVEYSLSEYENESATGNRPCFAGIFPLRGGGRENALDREGFAN